jgi:hypothetical protein
MTKQEAKAHLLERLLHFASKDNFERARMMIDLLEKVNRSESTDFKVYRTTGIEIERPYVTGEVVKV